MVARISRRRMLGAAGAAALGATAGSVTGCAAHSDPRTVLSVWDYWTAGGTSAAADWVHEQYMAHRPDVRVERQVVPFDQYKRTVLQSASAGDVPDVLAIDNSDVAAFAAIGLLDDLTDRIAVWSGAADILPAAWRTTEYRGRRFAVPDTVNDLALYYDRTVLDAAGVRPPSTWDELREAAARLTTDGRYGFAVSAVQSEEATLQFLPWLWQAGGDVPTLAGTGGQAALGLYRELLDAGHMSRGTLGWTQADLLNQFVNGQTAMMVNGPWQIPELSTSDVDWAVAPLPRRDTAATVIGAEDLGICAGAPHADLAWDFVTFCKSLPVATRYTQISNQLPSSRTVSEDPHWSADPALSVFTSQLDVARPRAYGENYLAISQDIQKAIQAALTGQAPVADALQQAQDAIGGKLAA
ncbi:ABC transporter substrate-binding protein [Pseudonocardia kunmingensis]|uniref:Carbohydrate ABC transporter substrate-binding protein (CUT1 family) n=1 Tax=Pseudonocardia kunmingensis TaxID=630975 RepID=A0A543DVP2_9PSEU|nr:sugar ABC transporter substrate-binding protein [Pseudonocardia kunmingensis]TQM13396.1 carbohydrate ABC transporter substrate-binding protein (CUT1 family) [Pseudonocardia kunmingensis]